MPLSPRAHNLLKRLFPKQVQGQNTLKFDDIQVSLTDEQVVNLTQLFEAQLKFHHNNKKQASDLHCIVPRDLFLAKLWHERFDNHDLMTSLSIIYSNFEEKSRVKLVAQTIEAIYLAVTLVYQPMPRCSLEYIVWALYVKMKPRERGPAHPQVSNQSPLVQVVKKIHESLYQHNRIDANGELEIARHLSHFCSISIEQALDRLPSYSFIDTIKYLIELSKDRDYFQKSRLKELSDNLLTQGMLPE